MTDIVNLQYFSIGFPAKDWNSLIERENFLDTIQVKLEDKTNLLYLSGDEGIGKTTLLGQFSRKNYKRTISLFFNPLNNIDLDLNFMRSNLTSQINFLLGHDNIEDEKEAFVSSEEYRLALFGLKKKFRGKQGAIYLVIDGLEIRNEAEKGKITKLLKEIPFGEDTFKIILSGTRKDFENLNPDLKKLNTEEISIIGFANHEMEEFFGKSMYGLLKQNPELLKSSKGMPNRLEVLKRLLESGTDVKKITKTPNFKNWLDLDTESIDLTEPVISQILSVTTLNENQFSLKEISQIISKTEEVVLEKIEETHVLQIINNKIQFISIHHQRFFKSLLRSQQKKVEELLIVYYASGNSLNSKFELSKLYANQKKWNKIPSIISESYIEGTLQETGSIERVNESIDLGFMSSEKMKKYSDAYKFSFQGSLVNELDNYLFWESEIKARISLNDFKGSIDLAERAVLKVDRLRLLSLIARRQKEMQDNVDEELMKLIKDLYSNTSLTGTGDAIFDIVADLIYAIPNLAIEILEKTTGNASESNINDWIVAKLSIAAMSNSEEKPDAEKDIKVKALEKLNNPSVKKINRAISFMVGKYSANRVLQEVEKLNDSNEKIKLLRLWLNNNKHHSTNLIKVIEITFDEIISASDDSGRVLDTLIDLSSQLINIRKKENIEKLLKRFKEFEPNISQVGLRKDYYTYKLNFFQAQYFLRRDKAEHLLIGILKDIDKIDDLLIKIESYCEVLYKLSITRTKNFTRYYNSTYGKIKRLSKELLEETANHKKLTKNFLEKLGKVKPEFAIEIAENINTSYSRDTCRLRILDAYLDNSIKRIYPDKLGLINSSFENDIPREIALQNILERYSNSKSLPFKVVSDIMPFLEGHKNIHSPERKLDSAILSLKIISKNDSWKRRLSKKYKKYVQNSWENIESDWERIDSGYTISSDLSKLDKVFAKAIFDETTEMKNHSWLDSNSVAYTFINSLKLLIKAYSALVKNKADTEDDFNRIKTLIDRIPSKIEKIQLWTELAILCLINQNINTAKKIYTNHIILLISDLRNEINGIDKLLESFVVIHYFDAQLAIEYLSLLSEYHKEEACIRISDFYISQRSPFEYYDGEIVNYKSAFDDIIKAVRILNEVQTDNLIFIQAEEIQKACCSNKDLTKIQRTEIRNRLSDIFKKKLPDQRNIKHEGYKILCDLQAELIAPVQNPDWTSYIQRAEKIKNTSDRLFVRGILVDEIPFTKKNDLKEAKSNLINKVFEDLEKLGSHYEFVDRVISLSSKMYDVSRNKWQEIVNRAFNFSIDFEEGFEKFDYQKNILDTIYRIDENFAKNLIKNSNETGKRNKELLSKHMDFLELSKKIKNCESIEENKKTSYLMIVEAVFKAQGALNSGKIFTKKISDVSQYLRISKKLPLSESYPVFLYFLSNSANLRLSPNQKSEIIEIQRETFTYMLNSINMVELLSQKRKLEHSIKGGTFIDKDFSENLLVRPKSREDAVNHIRNWIIDEAEEFIILTDPYLEKESLEILKFVLESDKQIEVHFLGCSDASATDLENDFDKHWRKLSDQEAPPSKVTFCWLPENRSKKLIHDRWILSNSGGLRLGTSLNSLGGNKESEISIIKPNEAFNILENTLREYLDNKLRIVNNQKIRYKSFTL